MAGGRTSQLSAWPPADGRAPPAPTHHYLYELALNNGHIYVGTTSKSMSERLRKHAQSPAVFVKRHGRDAATLPACVLLPVADALYHENLVTAKHMMESGADVARGGTHAQLQYSIETSARFCAFYAGGTPEEARDQLDPDSKNRYCVYKLSLKHHRILIGSTNDLDALKREHRQRPSAFLAEWGRFEDVENWSYEIVDGESNLTRDEARSLECKLTATLMRERGVQLVRGAMYRDVWRFVEDDLYALSGFIGHYLSIRRYASVEREITESFQPVVGAPSKSTPTSAQSRASSSKPSRDASSGRALDFGSSRTPMKTAALLSTLAGESSASSSVRSWTTSTAQSVAASAMSLRASSLTSDAPASLQDDSTGSASEKIHAPSFSISASGSSARKVQSWTELTARSIHASETSFRASTSTTDAPASSSTPLQDGSTGLETALEAMFTASEASGSFPIFSSGSSAPKVKSIHASKTSSPPPASTPVSAQRDAPAFSFTPVQDSTGLETALENTFPSSRASEPFPTFASGSSAPKVKSSTKSRGKSSTAASRSGGEGR